MGKTKILMVCLGNICRSPLAEGVLRSKLNAELFEVDSAGTSNYHVGDAPDHRSVEVARKNGIDISNLRGRQFQTSDFEYFDYIFVMDESNYENVLKLAKTSQHREKVSLLLDVFDSEVKREVPDPYYGGKNDFQAVFTLIDGACNAIAEKLNA
ncbi:low molecular weight protein-tyrosine-phosphatase [Capnocytophaga canimorsus]|uniref:protein-tyrosine-phosphatase n=2 Tax=Capnocytophaga canimorsus TaxID=28188 RepID=F9YUA2_CAPCC|nr:low molecular weight protein-tyrosine-phosphatase [Capnocytophaga canimorsus]AEK22957.1 Putative low molecular weight protein-tyrosine-phosphatase [Capnocytophaga canimorsus Cc5]ATA90696.1 low molecular weight phosphotyrosine protein phosphatase [Capnocytophaga canimorsus]VEJ18082.1 Low molecular weight protein-tyrosine-phosphatase yfkJ [Capnocytophaga canimorsus]